MIIKILWTGCPKCKLLQKTVEDAVKKIWLNCEIIKVDQISDIMQYDVMSMPWLVIDEKVIFSGRIPEPEEMTNILTTKKLSQDFADWSCCHGSCKN